MLQVHNFTFALLVSSKMLHRDIANIFYYYAFSIPLSKLRTKDNINAEKCKTNSNTTQKG